MKVINLFLLVSILFVSNSYSETLEISWPQANFPPYAFFFDAKLNKKGIHQKITSDLITQLNLKSNNIYKMANYERIVHGLSNKRPIIMVGILITKDRLKKGLLYSKIPINILYPNRVVIKKTNLKKFKRFMNGEKLDLEKALASNAISLIISKGRSYHDKIDKIVSKHKDNIKIYSRGSGNFEGNLGMLMRDRFDAILGYPVEVGYLAEKYSIDKNKLVMLPVDGTPNYIPNYIAVPNNSWGKNIIDKVNILLNKPSVLKKYNNYYASWLNDFDKKIFNNTFKKYYKTKFNILI